MKLITILLLLGVLALPASASEIISGGNSKINTTILEWSPQAVDYAYVNGTIDVTVEYYITTAESMTEYTWSLDEKPVSGDVDGNTYFFSQTWDNDSIGFHKVNFKGNNSDTSVEFQWYVNVYEIEGYRGGELFDVIDDTLENHYAQIKIRMFKDKIAKHGSNSAIAVQMVNKLQDEIAKRQITLKDLKSEFKAGNITIEEDVAALKHTQLEAKYNAKIVKEMTIISKEVIKDEESGKKPDKLLEKGNNEDKKKKEPETNVISNVTREEENKETSQEHKDTSQDVKGKESQNIEEPGNILDTLLQGANSEDQEKKESQTNVISNVITEEENKETVQDVKDEESGNILDKLLEIENKLNQEKKESQTNVRSNVIKEDNKETSQDVKDEKSGAILDKLDREKKESQTNGRSNEEYQGNTVGGNEGGGSGNKVDKSLEIVNTDNKKEKESQTNATSNATAAPTENTTAAPTENTTAAPTENTTVAPTENTTVAPTENATAATDRKYNGSTDRKYNGSTYRNCNGSTYRNCNGSTYRNCNGSTDRNCNGSTYRNCNGSTDRNCNGSTDRNCNGSTDRKCNGSTN